ncbi:MULTISPECIES: hypothetical protein [Thalassospira]|uniref:hypothetical protein n=1 Tax=Thalassospira TaxID=168934 RepID=UPI000DEDDFF4|nr:MULTISPECIES: hypothetical protein [Thalassospira]
MLRLVASIGFIVWSFTAVAAPSSSALLDQILLEALNGSLAANEQRVAQEAQTRDERKAEGDRLDIAREDEKLARKNLADIAKAERDRLRAEKEEAERREEMLAQAEREAKREAAAARRAAENAAAQASANSIIMEAITRNANAIASAQIQGQAAVNSAYATVDAINAQRRADAQAAAVANQSRAAAEAADRQAEAARRQLDAALNQSRNITQSGGQTGSTSTGLPGISGGLPSVKVPSGSQGTTRSSENRTIVIALGGGTASTPLAPTAKQTLGDQGSQGLSLASAPVSREEALAYCYHKKEKDPGFGADAWYCDGPTQNTLTNNPLPEALGYVGCRDADYEGRSVAFNKGLIFFCEKAIAPYDSNISERYKLPGNILARRNTYLCKDTSTTCTRENAINVTPGRGS